MSDGITIMMGTPEENGLKSGNSIPKYGVGKKCRGKVVNFKPYGFFVQTIDPHSPLNFAQNSWMAG